MIGRSVRQENLGLVAALRRFGFFTGRGECCELIAGTGVRNPDERTSMPAPHTARTSADTEEAVNECSQRPYSEYN